jgi:hypothetical protein
MTHQFSLFGFQQPKRKVPISAARIKEAKRLIAEGNGKGAAEVLRNLNDKLERFEARISNGKKF